jgi:hypothetical protein
MPKPTYPDELEVWGLTWTHTKGRRGWVGPAITDPEDPRLALAVACERIVRQHGSYVMLDPSITLDRFAWTEEDALIEERTDPDGTPQEGTP